MWFENLTGFAEQSPQQVREHLYIEDEQLISKINGKRWTYGRLDVVSLAALRKQVQQLPSKDKRLSVRELVADTQTLHCQAQNHQSLFQVASQFNLLEMPNPNVTPEQGVGHYEYDLTQGPACAMACGAGTIYRNYFVPVNGQIGQSKKNQIDTLTALGQALGNQDQQLWQMKNGYALASSVGLKNINQQLNQADAERMAHLRGLLQVGIQWHTQVTLPNTDNLVSQIYCSALPVAYSTHPASQWQTFAQLVLEGTYEATLCAAILNYHQTGNNRVFLTLVGGGAFGNQPEWIMQAVARALSLYQHAGLDVVIVSYRRQNSYVQQLLNAI